MRQRTWRPHLPGSATVWSENGSSAGQAAAPCGAGRRRAGVDGGGLAGGGDGFAGPGVDGLDGDLVAEALEASDVVAGLAAGVHALFVVAGAEVVVAGLGVGQQG